jgi:hypothetical protein
MKLEDLKERREAVPAVLLGFAAFLVLMILVKLIAFSVSSARAERLIGAAVVQGVSDANAVEKCVSKAKEAAEALKKKNLFSPPQKKEHPVKEVRGIIGSRALINGKEYELGESVGDAKIVAIEPTYVRIEWEGNTKVFAPISAADSGDKEGEANSGDKGGEAKSAEGGGQGESDDRDRSSLSREERVRRRAERIRMIKVRKEARRRERSR